MGLSLVLLSSALFLVSGLPALFFTNRGYIYRYGSVCCAVAGAAVGIAGIFMKLRDGVDPVMQFAWTIPLGQFSLKLDALSAVFLIPVYLIFATSSIYGLKYYDHDHNQLKSGSLRFFFGIAAAAMVMLLVAADGILFLMAWECMAVSVVFLINMEDMAQTVRTAAWLYFMATRASTMCIMALLVIWNNIHGSFALTIHQMPVGESWRIAFFILVLVAFGIKAGIMPLHFWLPSAHASAPSHISAMLSGVVLKMGVYGLIRFLGLLPGFTVGYGYIVLVLGGISAVLGVCFALGQHDIKRLLAYHSIENLGIIFMGVGIALIGQALDQRAWIVLGLVAALLHTWNHSLFKSVLFFGAGAIIIQTKTRLLDEMGGLAKQMPITAALFFSAALAIAGLPPLNGFVSEMLVYIGLFRALGIMGDTPQIAMVLFAPMLALTGALALACFVKVHGTVFLGEPRSKLKEIKESACSINFAMMILITACLVIGLVPTIFAGFFNQAVAAWSARQDLPSVADLAPLRDVGRLGMVLIAGCLLLWGSFTLLKKRRTVNIVNTWACGFTKPTHRMQYTSSSFAQMLVENFSWALRPNITRIAGEAIVPAYSSFEIHVADVVLDKLLTPIYKKFMIFLRWFRWIQSGYLHLYLMYIFFVLTVFVLLQL